jgi:hypothetical protein
MLAFAGGAILNGCGGDSSGTPQVADESGPRTATPVIRDSSATDATETPGGAPASTPTVPAPPPTGSDADRLRAAIVAWVPGVGFDPGCSIDTPKGPCATGEWAAGSLDGGVGRVGVHSDQDGAAMFFGRTADGSWGYWFATQNTGGPLVSLPGEMVVCADGDGLNLRAEPSTSAAQVALIPDGTIVRGDRFVLTEAGARSGDGLPEHGDGWYHITSPEEGWAYDPYLLASPNPFGCGMGWWP